MKYWAKINLETVKLIGSFNAEDSVIPKNNYIHIIYKEITEAEYLDNKKINEDNLFNWIKTQRANLATTLESINTKLKASSISDSELKYITKMEVSQIQKLKDFVVQGKII